MMMAMNNINIILKLDRTKMKGEKGMHACVNAHENIGSGWVCVCVCMCVGGRVKN